MDKLIVHYDSKCGLCLKSMQLIKTLDHRNRFEFLPLNEIDIQEENIPADSISLKVNENLYTKSNALIKIVSRLGLLGQFAYVFKIIPKSFRDRIYDRIATHRNMFFRASACKNNCISEEPK